jgi:hypothetical protein
MPSTRTMFLVGSFVIVCLSSVSCIRVRPGFFDEDRALTVKAIDQLHERLNLGRFDEIYRNTSEAYRTSRKRDDALGAMKLNRVQLGAFKEATHTELEVIVGAPVQIHAIYNSTFEKGAATELFVFFKEDQGPRLADYQIYAGTVARGGEGDPLGNTLTPPETR